MWSKYKVQKKQIYQNGGWVDTDPLQTRTGEKIGEYDSFSGCSGYDILYRWQPADPNEDWVCSGYTKYYKEYYQVSYDNGSTWTNVVPEQTRTGDFIEDYSWDCGYTAATKWKATYPTGTTTQVCDNTRTVAMDEVTRCHLMSIEINSCVQTIGHDAFYPRCVCDEEMLTNVIMKYGVTTIENDAFGQCTELTSVTMPNSLTSIGKGAFYNCYNLPEIEIPNSVTVIDNGAFKGCSGLTDITIGSSVTRLGTEESDLYGGVFSGCYNLDDVVLPSSLTIIGHQAFSSCSGLTSIDIPDSVNTIGNYAFNNCSNLQYASLPSGITKISDYTFAECSSLEEIEIPSGVTLINRFAFMNCSSLTSVTIPNTVTTIGQGAFYGCISLSSVTIPNGVTEIIDNAFDYCSGLTSINIPDSVTSIGTGGTSNDGCFSYCRSLTSVTIGNGVTSIGKKAFEGCNNLQSITISATTPPTLGNYAFDLTNNCNILVPSSSVNTYKNATGWSTYASRIQAIP